MINVLSVDVKQEQQPGAEPISEAQKFQAVISLDPETWRELIELFEIKEPMIKHRPELNQPAEGSTGWYTV